MLQSGIEYSSLILRRFTLEKEGRISAFIIDETMVQIGGRNETWLWIAIEPVHSTVLRIFLSRHRNMLVVESFLRSLVKVYGKHTAVYSDCGGTWYHEARSSLGLKHRLHTCLEKGLIERGAIQYFKDRTENFDDYYPCTKSRLCNLSHVYKWLCLFVFMHNAMIANIKFSILRYVIGGETIQLS
jgi:putative transposase